MRARSPKHGMGTAGIIAEYNPFHAGHLYHINKTRELGYENIIVVLGSNVTQRGELPIFSKWARAEAALLCGVDLVLELPAVYTAASTERFAAAVHILDGLGVADILSFGSECGNTNLLTHTALLCGGIEQTKEFKEATAIGLSYPAARTQAVYSLYQSGNVPQDRTVETANLPDIIKILSSPNDTLGLEYIKTILRNNLSIIPVAIKRKGTGHHGGENGLFASAGHIRQNLSRLPDFTPGAAVEIFNREIASGKCRNSNAPYERIALYCLKTAPRAIFENIPDISEGLHNRMYSAAAKAGSLDEYISLVKTKRYTRTRISRHILQLALRAHNKISPGGLTAAPPPYIRVLGHNKKGRALLSAARKKSSLPIFSSFSKLYRAFPEYAETERNASSLFSLCLPDMFRSQNGLNEYKQNVIVI